MFAEFRIIYIFIIHANNLDDQSAHKETLYFACKTVYSLGNEIYRILLPNYLSQILPPL